MNRRVTPLSRRAEDDSPGPTYTSARTPTYTWGRTPTTIKPILQAAADDPARFEGVTRLGVDEHIWHHVSIKPIVEGGRGPKELTGMVDLTLHPNETGEPVVRARLLDLVPGRSGVTYTTWLKDRGEAFRARVEVATLDPFHGYKNAIDDQLQDARSVLDAFHVVRLGTKMVDDVRRRVQQDIHGDAARRKSPGLLIESPHLGGGVSVVVGGCRWSWRGGPRLGRGARAGGRSRRRG